MIPDPTKPPVTVLLIDDSEVVCAGLRTLLGTDAAVAIVGEAATVASGVEAGPGCVRISSCSISGCRMARASRPAGRF